MVAWLGMPGAGGSGRRRAGGAKWTGFGRPRRLLRRAARAAAVRGRRGLWPEGTMKYLVSVGSGPGG